MQWTQQFVSWHWKRVTRRWIVSRVARDSDSVADHGRLPSRSGEVVVVHGGVGGLVDEGAPQNTVQSVVVPALGVYQ